MDRTPIIVPAGGGRPYPMGRMYAVFKADGAETANRYSVSEWWLEPGCQLPNQHQHEEDHVYYVIEGTLAIMFGEETHDAGQGSYIVIPGGTPHAFANQSRARTGFMSLNVPGGFEEDVPGIAAALALVNPVG